MSDAEIERDEDRLVKALETAVDRKKRLVLLRELFEICNSRRQQNAASMYFNIPVEDEPGDNKKQKNNNISNNPYEDDAVNKTVITTTTTSKTTKTASGE